MVILWLLEVKSCNSHSLFYFDSVGRCDGVDVRYGQMLTLWLFRVILWPLQFKPCPAYCSVHNYQNIYILNWRKMCRWRCAMWSNYGPNYDPMTFQDHRILFKVILWASQFKPCHGYCSVPNYQSLFIWNGEEDDISIPIGMLPLLVKGFRDTWMTVYQ